MCTKEAYYFLLEWSAFEKEGNNLQRRAKSALS